MEIDFDKQDEGPYNLEFVEKIRRGAQASKEGKGLKIEVEDLWK